MASAMVDGLLAQGVCQPSEITCIGGGGSSAERLVQRTGINGASDLAGALAGADVVVLAFKPQHLASADPRLAELTAGKVVVSVLAAKTLARLSTVFPGPGRLSGACPTRPPPSGRASPAGARSILCPRTTGG